MRARKHNTKAAVLTAAEVIEIRRRYSRGSTQRELGNMFGMSTEQIGRIVRGESWKHLPLNPQTDEELLAEGAALEAKVMQEMREKGLMPDTGPPDEVQKELMDKLQKDVADDPQFKSNSVVRRYLEDK